MAKKENKNKQLKIFKELYVLGGLSILVLSLLTLTKGGIFNKSSIANPTTPPFEAQLDNGVYTNYKGGYRFSYQPDQLEYDQSGSNSKLSIWKLKQNSSDKQIMLLLRDDTEFEVFKQLSRKETNRIENEESIITRLSLEEKGDYKVIKTFSKSQPDFPSDLNVSYQTAWIRENKPMITLTFVTTLDNELFLKSQKPLFDQMVESFEFIRTNN